ncbi:UNKNOWN [Stylonychia lemnae]|uniref:Uncharacterized protein n=1 Tax=Stylonychia lemnae TaxID=5949 RepID=A0A078AF06_STYLE|nr:UNKNOWN [Stylonychia lemnae]|eukprot:CDW80805.1 UNKNOWN [Stylonychia lemnae]
MFVQQQSQLAFAKYGNVKKSPMIAPEKKKFDSGDYFMEYEKLRQAAGLSSKDQQTTGSIEQDQQQ